MERKDEIRTCKVRNDHSLCSYRVGDCLHVVVTNNNIDKLYLLHKSNEEEKLHLPNGKELKINILNYRVIPSIVLYPVYPISRISKAQKVNVKIV